MHDSKIPATMKIEKLYVYPIKSLRGASVPLATLTPHGIPYDRQFMLLKDHGESKSTKDGRYENMHIGYFPEMCLFTTSIQFPSGDETGEIEVTCRDPKINSTTSIKIPLHPDVESLSPFEILMHQSPVTALAMPRQYTDWFSSCFGFDVAFVYLGLDNYRPVLGNLAPNANIRNPIRRERHESQHKKSSGSAASWLSGFVNGMPGLPTIFNPNATTQRDDEEDQDYRITFADCAPYLIASTTSLINVSARLPEDQPMDITKFRPNIIVSGAGTPFEEDFWAELCITSPTSSTTSPKTTLTLTTNCVRCTSINVDYSTGTFGAGETGQVFKKLQKDRRVDKGHKYNPVFGRYGFLTRGDDGVAEETSIRVGDEVTVTRRNEQHTIFRWPGIGQTLKTDLFAT